MSRFLRPMSLSACLVLVAVACEYDPSGIDGPLGECDGLDADLGFGFNADEDPAGGATYTATSASDTIVIANGPVDVDAGTGHDIICANPLGWGGTGVVVDGGPGLDECRDVSGVTLVNCEFVDGVPDLDAVNAALGRGINFGNLLEAPREGDWGLEFEADFFSTIANEGFDHVRVPISWDGYAGLSAPFTIPTGNDPTVTHPDYDNIWERVDWVIDQADANGLIAIVNMHHYDAIHDDPIAETERFLAMWDQIATRYADAGNHVVFELLNEPHGAFDDDPELWNSLAAAGLATIRSSNPLRPVMIGPVGYNSIDRLDDLVLPDDPYLLSTVHVYDPFPFTHQGAEWIEPQLDTGVAWNADQMGLAPGIENYSWSTQTTGTSGAFLVDFDTQWAGFSPRFDESVDPTSVTVDVGGSSVLRVVCTDADDNETELGTLVTSAAPSSYTIDMSSCPNDTIRLFFQNTTTDPDVLAFTEIDVCTSSSCSDIIMTSAQAIEQLITDGAAWSAANEVPMNIGEFGAYSAAGASDLSDRADWTATVQQAALASSMSTSYWEFGAGFGAYDLDTDQWVAPLRDALLS